MVSSIGLKVRTRCFSTEHIRSILSPFQGNALRLGRSSLWPVCFLPSPFLLLSGSAFQVTIHDASMTILITLSWHFLLILGPERSRRVSVQWLENLPVVPFSEAMSSS